MSTKTFPYRPFGGGDNLLIFVVISLTIHILFAFGILTLKPLSRTSAPKEKGPLEVELLRPPKTAQEERTKPRYVVEIPPGPASPHPPKDFTHYADRNAIVEKETYPEPSRRPAHRSLPAPVPGSKGAVNEAAKGMKDSAGKGTGTDSAIKKDGTAQGPAMPVANVVSHQKAAEASGEISESGKAASETVRVGSEAPSGKGSAGPAGSKAATAARGTPARPDLFPTHERITELEKRYEAEAPRGEKGKTLQLNTSELRYQKYLINMKNRIEFYWEYPALAARSGWQGVLNISFTIKKDGTVTNINVGKSSNYPVLDDAAVTALRLAVPFPPFPDDFGIEEININGQFEYKLYGGAAREGG